MIEHYFYLIKTRFGDAYSFTIAGKEPNRSDYVPTGALQTLVENVVKHNKTTKDQKIATIIDVQDKRVTISNTKSRGLDKVVSFGTGLQNLNDRYQMLFDKNIVIEETEDEFKVVIPVVTLTESHN